MRNNCKVHHKNLGQNHPLYLKLRLRGFGTLKKKKKKELFGGVFFFSSLSGFRVSGQSHFYYFGKPKKTQTIAVGRRLRRVRRGEVRDSKTEERIKMRTGRASLYTSRVICSPL